VIAGVSFNGGRRMPVAEFERHLAKLREIPCAGCREEYRRREIEEASSYHHQLGGLHHDDSCLVPLRRAAEAAAAQGK